MYELKDYEKETPVMVYTEGALYHGKVVTRDIVRVHIWLRTDAAPSYIHLLDAQMIRIEGTVTTMKFPEVYVPVNDVIAFHVAPEIEVAMDYQADEANRRMAPVKAVVDSFFIDSDLRISTQTELGASLEVTRKGWLSLYNANINNPYLPQMKVKVAFLLVRPEKVAFGIME